MNTNATASIHIKPCNIAQSDEHNRRDEQYLKALNPANIYIRKDLTCLNSTYVPSDMKGTSLQEYYDSLKAMVKAKAQGETTKVTIRNARRESKTTEKQSEIDKLDQRITAKEAMLDGLVTETAALRKEKYSIDTSNEWKDPALRAVSGYLVATNEVIKYSIEAIQDYAYSGTGGRGGNHGDCFSDKEAYIIKKLMMNLAAIAKTTFQVIGNWLVYVASRIAKFNDWELNRAERGVKSVADGE